MIQRSANQWRVRGRPLHQDELRPDEDSALRWMQSLWLGDTARSHALAFQPQRPSPAPRASGASPRPVNGVPSTRAFFDGFVRVLEQLHRVAWHDDRNGVLINELRMPITAKQHAEIVEPSHHALELDPVHKKDREGNFVLADVVEEGVLQVLRTFARHRSCLVSPLPLVLAARPPNIDRPRTPRP